MKKRIGLTLASAMIAAGVLAAPAHAAHFRHHPVSKANYAVVHQWMERSYAEIVWGLEGHRTNQWTDPTTGYLYRTKTYPTKVTGDTARMVLVRYPISSRHPDELVWAVAATKWCVPAPTDQDPAAVACSPAPPIVP